MENKTKKIHIKTNVDIGYYGTDFTRVTEVEVSENITEDEINEIFKELEKELVLEYASSYSELISEGRYENLKEFND